MDALISRRRRTVLQVLAAASLVAACGDRPGAARANTFTFGGPTMGSAYSLKIAGEGIDRASAEAAHDAVREALGNVEARMSAYLRDSELSCLNRAPANVPFALSDDLLAVLSLAQRVAADTDRAFDVTVAPLVDAWGFGPGRLQRVVPVDEVARLSRDVGADLLSVDPDLRSARKAHATVRADLSGIAKGYGVDKAAQALEARGVERYMIEAGGEVRTRGLNGDERPWQIAIEEPDATPQRPRFVVPMSGLSMATSGDYRIFFERDGRRYCHEIDPRRGRPIDNGLASASVVANDCAYADALATALMVMGAERALAFARAHDVAAYLTERTAGGLRPLASPAFHALGGYAIG